MLCSYKPSHTEQAVPINRLAFQTEPITNQLPMPNLTAEAVRLEKTDLLALHGYQALLGLGKSALCVT